MKRAEAGGSMVVPLRLLALLYEYEMRVRPAIERGK